MSKDNKVDEKPEIPESVLLFFREASLKEAEKALAEATGIVEARKIEEHGKGDE